MDFEAWRCCHDDKKFCPDEGCPKGFCARDNGWKPGDPTPSRCLPVNPFTTPLDDPRIKEMIAQTASVWER